MIRDRHFALLFLGIILLLATSLADCASEPEINARISVKPDMISLSAREGENPGGQSLEIYSSAEIKPLMWQARDDALWLHLSPSWGTFDCGVSKAAAFADTSAISAGYYIATISIFVQEAHNSPLTVPVQLDVIPSEDPTVVAARKFWESSYYGRYWDINARSDAMEVVRAYNFPGPYSEYDWSYSQKQSRVEIKSCEFEYDPGKHRRPVAMVYCKVFFEVTYVDPRPGYYRYEEWVSNLDVVLEVEAGPYTTDHNEWEVIDYYAHAGASSLLVKMYTVPSEDSSGCGCGG
jgi:hypothetical protein